MFLWCWLERVCAVVALDHPRVVMRLGVGWRLIGIIEMVIYNIYAMHLLLPS